VILDAGAVVAQGPIVDLLGAGGGLVVELDDDPGQVPARLAEKGIDVRVHARSLHLTATDSIDLAAEATTVLAAAGVGVRRLHTGRRSLQDVFFGAVE
jgi:hypothetical protein